MPIAKRLSVDGSRRLDHRLIELFRQESPSDTSVTPVMTTGKRRLGRRLSDKTGQITGPNGQTSGQEAYRYLGSSKD
jgi:hypothetical protein